METLSPHSRSARLRLPNTSCFSLPGMHGEELAGALAAAEIIVGTGAACSAGAIESSKTLRAMGVAHKVAMTGLSVSLSRFSTLQDITTKVDPENRARG